MFHVCHKNLLYHYEENNYNFHHNIHMDHHNNNNNHLEYNIQDYYLK